MQILFKPRDIYQYGIKSAGNVSIVVEEPKRVVNETQLQ